ncbi:MAG: oleate hydratase [Paracoccaceae bacterium]
MRPDPDSSQGYWRNSPENCLPPPDLLSPYARNRPVAPEGIERRKAWIVGGGIAGMAAAFYLIRDGGMPAANITILENQGVEGGSLDGAGDAEKGYLIRGGREMNWNYDNLWDMFQDVPALELPEGYSVLDEYRLVNDNDPNWSKARLMHRQGQIRDFSTLGLSTAQQWELIRLLLKRKEELDDITVEQFFSKGFLDTNFWFFWRTMFAFQNWHSVLEMKLYMHRFLDALDGLNDMSALIFPKYNQFDTFVVPLARMLRDKGVQIRLDTQVDDMRFETEGDRRRVTALICRDGAEIAVAPDDLVFALTGSITEGTAYGDMETVPAPIRGRTDPGPDSAWTLWRNLAKAAPVFGKPEKFYCDTDRSAWESATLTCRPSPFTEKLAELSVNDPWSGRTVTGGIITFTDSAWLMSFTCNRQPHFPDQPGDVLVIWVFGLLMDKPGDRVKKPMPSCTGREILEELCHHLGIADRIDEVAAATKVRLALMPYITAEFMPRAAGDRPRVVPEGCTNLALLGQFVETNNDVVFTMESSVRTARIGVYTLLALPKQVPDLNPVQYDIRNLLRAARALNNDRPFVGERLLHRLLDKTYFAHILPPLPQDGPSPVAAAEEEFRILLAKGGEAVKGISSRIAQVLHDLGRKP